MDAGIVFQQMLVILLLVLAGFLTRRSGMVGSGHSGALSKLVSSVFNPALIISSMISDPSPKNYAEIRTVFLAAALMYAFLFAAAYLLTAGKRRMYRDKTALRLIYIFPNLGFIGIPVVRAVLGEHYILYVAIFMLEFSILIYSYGELHLEEGARFSLKSLRPMLNIGTFGSLLALFLFFTGIPLPLPIASALEILGSATTPVAMIVTGFAIAEQSDLKKILTDGSTWVCTLLKMLVIPAAFILLLKVLPLPEDIRSLSLIMIAMPAANMPLILISEKGWDTGLYSRVIMLTTVLSVITLPLLVLLYQAL